MLALRLSSRGCTRLAPLLARGQSTAVTPTVKATENSLPLPHEKYTDSTTWEKHQEYIRHGEPNMRTYNYMIMGGARLMGASLSRLLLIKFLAQMNPSADVLALANVEVDVSNLEVGKSMTVKWRGKPVFVRRRTAEEIADANNVNMSELRDPQADADRVRAEPEWLVLLGVCTHLGCVPIPNAGEFGGWFCPCHGSHYDISGRIRKGPAPYNMEVRARTRLAHTRASPRRNPRGPVDPPLRALSPSRPLCARRSRPTRSWRRASSSWAKSAKGREYAWIFAGGAGCRGACRRGCAASTGVCIDSVESSSNCSRASLRVERQQLGMT